MDQNSRSHHHHPLGINKLGKSIRKSPLHQPNYQKHPPPPPPPQPQVYNISKTDFRSIVQQLTGSPARDPASAVNIPAPPQPKPPSSRLMKIRPPPLTPISRSPPLPLQNSTPNLNPNPNPNLNPIPGFYPRPIAPGWADSPVSAYMRYLESSLLSSDSSRRMPAQGLMPPASVGSVTVSMHPGMLLPSPGSQFPLPSPSSFLNLLSPKSPYPLLSPGFLYPQSFAPNFSFSPIPQSGILGPGPGSQPPPSPSLLFPHSPSGFLPLLSPRWREM